MQADFNNIQTGETCDEIWQKSTAISGFVIHFCNIISFR